MKKFYSFAIAIMAALSMNGQIYIVGTGDGLGWDPSNPLTIEPNGDGSYSFELKGLSAFKVSTSKGDWAAFDPNCRWIDMKEDALGTERPVYTSNGGGNITAPWKGDYKFELQLDAEPGEDNVIGKCVVTTTTPKPGAPDYTTWYLNVLYNNNNDKDNGVKFNAEGVATNPNCFIGSNGFKLKIWNGASDVYLSTGSAVTADESTVVDSDNYANMTVAGANPGNVYNVTYNCVTKELSLELVETLSPTTVYIRGTIVPESEGNNWVNAEMTKEGDKYVYSANVKAGNFGIAAMYTFNNNSVQGAWYSATDNGEISDTGNFVASPNGSKNYNSTLTGDYKFIFDPEAETLTVEAVNASIDEIANDSVEAVYYNLQGVRVDNPSKGQLYIKKQGAIVSKIIVK